jgi:hypothetical protein
MWHEFWDSMPERLLPAHATNAATERHWSLWGRMYCAVRSLLGMQRAEALTAIRAAKKTKD